MRTSTIVSISVGTTVAAVLAYAVYFDYQRRNNADFRKALKRDARRQARKAKEENEAQGKRQKEELKMLVQETLEEGFPKDIEEKEAYFLQQISQGEAMANDGSDPVGAALCFYRGLKVYPEPSSLINIYDTTVPKPVLEILAQMVSFDNDLKVGSFGQTKDSGSESGGPGVE